MSDQFSIGPYLTFSFAQYTSRDVTLPSQIAALVGPLDLGAATHNWFGIGVLGRFSL